ncbi:MAG TPA: choice-of-anchor Q domain-containing protein, partial [Candidatus Acidoferrum sp.]|nr:choice-of-anchor Q domain-containing protein [Candidatus Acidoferrum sp.]
AHSAFSNPQFADPAKGDFHLRQDSPAIGSGDIKELPVGDVDLDGLPRIKNGKIDIGCYQTK